MTDNTIGAVNQDTEGNKPVIIVTTLIPTAATTGEVVKEDAGAVAGLITNSTTTTPEETMIEKKPETINTANAGDTMRGTTTTTPLLPYLPIASQIENLPTGMQTPGRYTICPTNDPTSVHSIKLKS